MKKQIFHIITKFLVFLILISFVVTCNFVLFLNVGHMDVEEIRSAAPATFINVLFLTLLFFVLDEIRQIYKVEKPIKSIKRGIKKIVAGNFDTRIPYISGEDSLNTFDAIIKGINDMTKELSGVETLRTDFISNVSHEIKTPLAVIQNYGTMLQAEDIDKEKRMEYSKAITEQTRKLTSLITNILKLNKLENQQIFPEKKRYNLTEQICECLLSFEQVWEKKDLQIETDMEEDIMVCEDEELLSLVWNNLFSNAIKFSNEGGSIYVHIKKVDGNVQVSVRDEGCGISTDIGKHIFEKFYQGDTSHAVQGNGLGLALVKRVVDIVGGDIRVQSIYGEGSTFIVSIKDGSQDEI